jgi:hypothetical protein
MQLTQQETKLVKRLRRNERSWWWERWLYLGLGLIIELCYGFILFSMLDRLKSVAFDVNALGAGRVDFYFLWPKCMIMLPVGAVLIGWTLGHWQGNAQRKLLLRLLDAHQEGITNHEHIA